MKVTEEKTPASSVSRCLFTHKWCAKVLKKTLKRQGNDAGCDLYQPLSGANLKIRHGISLPSGEAFDFCVRCGTGIYISSFPRYPFVYIYIVL